MEKRRKGDPPQGGRPPFKPTKEHRRMVEMLVGFGHTHRDICLFIINPQTGNPIDPETLEKHFRKEIDTGVPKMQAHFARNLMKQSNEGNTTATIFALKCRAGWKEPAQRVEHAGAADAPPIRVESLTDEQLDILIARLEKAEREKG